MKVLSLNCQKAYQPTLKAFLHNTLEAAIYDFILLQEANAPVLALMPSLGAYGMLNLFNQETKEQSHLCILYRSSFELTDSALHSFAFMHPDPHLQFAGFGLLLGTFRMNGQMVQIGSVHLHPGLRPAGAHTGSQAAQAASAGRAARGRAAYLRRATSISAFRARWGRGSGFSLLTSCRRPARSAPRSTAATASTTRISSTARPSSSRSSAWPSACARTTSSWMRIPPGSRGYGYGNCRTGCRTTAPSN